MDRVKITPQQITYGPKEMELDDVTSWTYAGDLERQGYRKISNAYCRIARIDKEDWMQILAKEFRCAPADFYMMDGSGPSERWMAYYCRMHSKDVKTVSPSIMRRLKGWN